MKTEVLKVVAKGRVAVLEEELPELGENDVLVRVKKSLVSPGTERAFILGLENTSANYPFKSGYAACSVVEAAGPGVTRLAPGDRVTCFGIAHQKYGVIHESRLVKLPDAVSDEQGAFGALGVICMQGVRKARLELGEACAVIGMGPIGQLALQIAKAAGAYPVIAADKTDDRLRLAQTCGADAIVSTQDENWRDRLQAAAPGGVNAVIECTGFPAAIQSSLDAAARFGRVVLLGSTRGDCTINVYRDIHKKGLTLIGAHLSAIPEKDSSPGYWTYQRDLECFVSLMARKKVDPAPLITERCEKKDILALYGEKILTWDSGVIGAIIDWG